MFPNIHKAIGTPTVGTPVALLSQRDGRPYNATVRTWINSTAALVVSARLAVDAEAVQQLADQRVWMSVQGSPHGFTVFSGVTQPADASTLEITGIALLVSEPRRATARVSAETSVALSTLDRAPTRLRGVDLARGGVRVALSAPTDVVLGEQVDVDVLLEDGTSVPATGTVTRVDDPAGEAVVRFDDLSSEQGTRIDRFVLLRLTASR